MDAQVVRIFAAVVVGEGAAQGGWIMRAGAVDGNAEVSRRLSWKVEKLSETGLALDANE